METPFTMYYMSLSFSPFFSSALKLNALKTLTGELHCELFNSFIPLVIRKKHLISFPKGCLRKSNERVCIAIRDVLEAGQCGKCSRKVLEHVQSERGQSSWTEQWTHFHECFDVTRRTIRHEPSAQKYAQRHAHQSTYNDTLTDTHANLLGTPHTNARTHADIFSDMLTHLRSVVAWTDSRWLEHSDRCNKHCFYFHLFFHVRAMPTLSVTLTSCEEVLPDIFVKADGSLRQLAHAAVARLAVVPSRCVLLSPAGDRMAHTQTPSDEKLVGPPVSRSSETTRCHEYHGVIICRVSEWRHKERRGTLHGGLPQWPTGGPGCSERWPSEQ